MAREHRVALVIGNGRYRFSPLLNPVNDARAISEALQFMGFQVTLLENATIRQMSDAARLEKPAKTAKPALPASTLVASPADIPDKQPAAEPAADSSAAYRLAMAEPASPPPPAAAQAVTEHADTMHLDHASLPLSFGRQRVLDRRLNPVTKQTRCILASESVNIQDGYDRTNVQVLLTLHSDHQVRNEGDQGVRRLRDLFSRYPQALESVRDCTKIQYHGNNLSSAYSDACEHGPSGGR